MRLPALFLLLVACAEPAPQQPTEPNPPDKPTGDKPVEPPVVFPKQCDPFAPRSPAPELFIGPDGLEQKLIALMGMATTSLDVFAYDLTVQSLIDALIATQARGVDVRVVLDRNRNKKAKPLLTAGGVAWHDSPERFAYSHSKSMLIDGKTTVIMSMNMDAYSMEGERNYGIVSSDAGDAEDVAKIFEADWAGTPDALELPCTRLIVSPINARERLKQLISTSTDSLDLAVMYLSDDELYEAVVERKKAGVSVRVLLADPAWMQYNDDTAMALAEDAPGIAVKYLLLEVAELHAKLIISDDRAFVGSENMSSNSLDNNREIGAFVSNTDQVRAIRNQFDTDWTAGVSP